MSKLSVLALMTGMALGDIGTPYGSIEPKKISKKKSKDVLKRRKANKVARKQKKK
jgi:hypothetical protein